MRFFPAFLKKNHLRNILIAAGSDAMDVGKQSKNHDAAELKKEGNKQHLQKWEKESVPLEQNDILNNLKLKNIVSIRESFNLN